LESHRSLLGKPESGHHNQRNQAQRTAISHAINKGGRVKKKEEPERQVGKPEGGKPKLPAAKKKNELGRSGTFRMKDRKKRI